MAPADVPGAPSTCVANHADNGLPAVATDTPTAFPVTPGQRACAQSPAAGD